jgi:hypothetical protein
MSKDLYFIGIKKDSNENSNENSNYKLIKYKGEHVIHTGTKKN